MTTIEDIIRRELPAFAQRTKKETLRVLEVGVLRARDDEHRDGDGHSTLAFARLLATMPGSTLTGIDLNPSDAEAAVADEGLDGVCTFHAGDSLELMRKLSEQGERFDVVYLDADNSAQGTMAEYSAALKLVDRPALILGDDMNLGHGEVEKGRILIPYLRETGTPFRILHRHTPWDQRDILLQEIA